MGQLAEWICRGGTFMNSSFLSQNISPIFWQNSSREFDSPCMLCITSSVVLALETSSIEMTYPLNICFSTNTLVFSHRSSAFSPKTVFVLDCFLSYQTLPTCHNMTLLNLLFITANLVSTKMENTKF